jgi:hypothetical protein
LKDLSGKGHHGKLQQTQRVQGRQGQALKLDGQGRVTLPSVPSGLDPANKPFTVGAWCKPEQGDGVLISHGGGGQGFSLYLKDSVPHFALRSGGELFLVSGKTKLTLGEWVHLSADLKSTGNIRVLADGKPAASIKANAIRAKPKEGLTIGDDPGSSVGDYRGPLPFSGLIEDVRIYWGELDTEGLEAWAKK